MPETKAEQGWAAMMPREMALAAGVAEGSLIILHLRDCAKFQDLFAELKRRGD